LKVKLRYDYEATIVGAILKKDALRLRSINHPFDPTLDASRCRCHDEGHQLPCDSGQHIFSVPWRNKCGNDRRAAEARGWVETLPTRKGFFHPPPGTVVTYQTQRGLGDSHPRYQTLKHVHEAECDCDACRLVCSRAHGAAAQPSSEWTAKKG
jgi:hypothetical protein